ncbi:hypothetical protein HUG17_10091 [Dermatophagoides farinae]|uniref:Uncharacterized protein n=1 Tax=Dermatophagoides farinae TaxID=6954 RepID=A0A9D4P5F9_DERFA|nr:uncharacterized protein LOC124497655 [Dermatophagoides farinae]KAH7643400.1 hypothetical protein HUG17_10091 [Dermatophagoides farinae]
MSQEETYHHNISRHRRGRGRGLNEKFLIRSKLEMTIYKQLLMSSSLGLITAFSVGWIIFTTINLLFITEREHQHRQQPNTMHYNIGYYLVTCIYSLCLSLFLFTSIRSSFTNRPITKSSLLNITNNDDDNDDTDDEQSSIVAKSSTVRLSQSLWIIFIIEMLLFTRNLFTFMERKHLSTIHHHHHHQHHRYGNDGDDDDFGHKHQNEKYMELWFYTLVSLIKMLLSRFVIYIIDDTVKKIDWDIGDPDIIDY